LTQRLRLLSRRSNRPSVQRQTVGSGKAVYLSPAATEADRANSAARFTELALPHLNDVYTLAHYLMSNANEAEEATNECFLRAFRYFDNDRTPTIKPWLVAILYETVASVKSPQLGLKPEGGLNNPATTCQRESDGTEEQSKTPHQSRTAIQRKLRDLPPEFRDVILLHDLLLMPYSEIAFVIKMPIADVMTRLASARRQLADVRFQADGDVNERAATTSLPTQTVFSDFPSKVG
jgi:RNA polymerase sigma-70 factor (ECF subfamily)